MRTHLLVLFFAAALSAGCRNESKRAFAEKYNSNPIDCPAEIVRAKSENKLLLLEFGSSDSCPPCMELQDKVFSRQEFLDYEKSNLIFLRVDFPMNSKLPPAVEATNVLLAQQFQTYGFPTLVALDQNGNEFWRMPAKDDPNPSIDTRLFEPPEFITLIESVKAKRK